VRWVFVSLAVHAALIAWLARDRGDKQLVAWHVPTLPAFEHVETPTLVELIEEPAVAGGGGAGAQAHDVRPATRAPVRSSDAWEQIDVRVDEAGGAGTGHGNGTGDGNGSGSGIGLGAGGGIRVAQDVPTPPPPPAISKARPAKLVWPNRDEEVDDETNLFTAKVTVDTEGFVVGARMTTSRNGAKADRAADAIWTFRYAPALDDDGRPIKSTFEQSFQVR
jgi:hypothetical protein